MIYLDLFLGFLEVGCFSFGGGFGAIPLIRDVVLRYGWLDEEMLTYMVAVSESTPGPIMVNLATYVGSSQAGFWGALLATGAVVLPSFFIILLVTCVLKHALKNRYVKAVLQGLKPCVIGIVLAVGAYMVLQNCVKEFEPAALVITLLLVAVKIGYHRVRKKKLSAIGLILISAVLGIIWYGV